MGMQLNQTTNPTISGPALALVIAIGAASVVALPAAHAQEWMRQFGSGLEDRAAAVVPDGVGGVLFTGHTVGDLAAPNLGPYGTKDIVLGRYDASGNQIWLRQFGTSSSERSNDLVADAAGDIFVTGRTGGAFGAPLAGGPDVFVARFAPTGETLWVSQFGSAQLDEAHSIALDGAGGVFIGGETYGDLGAVHQGGSIDAFLARLDQDGNVLWIEQFGTGEYEFIKEVVSDGAGGVFVAGETFGVLAPSNGRQTDAFLARYDGQRNRLWIRQFGTQQYEKSSAMMPDGAGGVILGGTTDYHLVGQSAGRIDIFLAQYTADGQQTWIRQIGTSWDDVIRSIVPDGAGGIIIGGSESLWSESFATLARYDPAGVEIWSRRFGTTERDFTMDIAEAEADPGMVFASVFTWGSLAGPQQGFGDIVIAKMGEELLPCYADCDQSTGARVLDIFDFLCFQNGFVNSQPYACDCDVITGPGVCDIFDFLCFQNHFAVGCP
jgi:Beta-propeller repeat